ncbi:unnamed protein product [Malus baccata var. baccata]
MAACNAEGVDALKTQGTWLLVSPPSNRSVIGNTSLFVKMDDGDLVLLLLYVDDKILTGSNPVKIQVVIDDLASVFDLKDMGRSIVRALQYLTFTRPDIAHSMNLVCQFMTQPTNMHMLLVKRILRYIQATVEYSLQYTKSKGVDITTFSDSDWAADINTRQSITGFVVYFGDNLISWQSKKESIVSRSSTKAEYKALAYCATYIVQTGDLMVHYLPTDDQVADVFTKGLHSPIFLKHCKKLGLGVMSAANLASAAQLHLRGSNNHMIESCGIASLVE